MFGWFVLLVIVIVLIVFVVWIFFGLEFWLSYGLIVVVFVFIIVCLCVFGFVMLMLIMVGVGKGVNFGLLIKNVEVFERLEKIDIFVVDKIGMFMEGKLVVMVIVLVDGWSEMEFF